MKLRFLVSISAVALSSLCFGQTDVTCHVTPFNAPSGYGLGSLSTAVSINRYGNAIGDDVNGKPYIRYSNGQVRPMGISIPHANYVQVWKRNASGVAVGYYQTSDNPVQSGGFINSGSTTTTYHFPEANNTSLQGINMYSSIVGNFYGAPSGNGIFELKNGHVTVLNPPAAFAREVSVTGISDTGVIVGTYALQNSPPDPDQTTHGFVYANGQWQDLAYPGRLDTYITDINASGEIVGLLDDGSPDYTFIYKDGKFYHPVFVLPDGTKLSSYAQVYGVNGYGQISGLIRAGSTFKPYVGTCSF